MSKAYKKYDDDLKKTGYVFLGWYAKRNDGKGCCYTPGSSKASWIDQGYCDGYGKYYLYKDEQK